MLPTLLSVGPLTVSSFGFFMALAFLAAVFVSWKLARFYDIDEEKSLDLSILTFFGGLLGARIFFVLFNWELFPDFFKIVLINRYPGLSFWGGILGGLITFWFFSKRLRFNFWQIADFLAVSFLAGQIVGDVGCFLGGCEYGISSDSVLATPVVGLLGNRLPVAIWESLALLPIFFYLWRSVVKFHFSGKILAMALVFEGIIKFTSEFYRGDVRKLTFSDSLSLGHLFSLGLLVIGVLIFYARSKRGIIADLRSVVIFFTTSKYRNLVLSNFKKGWYNYQVSWKIKLKNMVTFLLGLPKFLKRRLNVKSTPKNIREG